MELGVWRADFVYDVATNGFNLYVRRRVSGGFEVLTSAGVVLLGDAEGIMRTPTLRMDGIATNILADALARVGVGLGETSPVKAMADHIKSLEKQTDRLFELAKGK